MDISYLLLLVVFIVGYGEGQNECADELRCGRHGPAIRFPFGLKDRQQDDCFIPGFNLSCTATNDTVLQLPISIKLFVKKIDYKSQVIHLYDPDYCFPRQLRGLELTYPSTKVHQLFSSPFHFNQDDMNSDDFNNGYAIFNCSQAKGKDNSRSHQISCLSGPSNQVYATDNYGDISYLPTSSCTKMYSVRLIPYNILMGHDKVFELRWNSNQACTDCEVKGKNCRLKNKSSSYKKKKNKSSETECFPRPPKHTRGASKKLVATCTGAILGSSLLVLVVVAVYYIYRYDKVEKANKVKLEKFLEDYRNFKPTRYLYADIERITNQFNEKLGEGAYGTVFKGKLSNEIYVAVKILNMPKKNGEEFINEVGTMGRIHHVNVVRLVGFCADGFKQALVYEFLPNGSLEKFISSTDTKKRSLGWDKLQDIALDIAKGIEYLHQGCDQRILHFDIKPHNILLDQNFNPKISDFGHAKLCSKDQSVVSMTTARGTMGYIAPEVFSRNFGNVSYKADVYSFGMLLLEIVGGRKNVDVEQNTSQVYFPEWIYNLMEQKEDLQVFIENDSDAIVAKKLAIVGLWCIQWHPGDRPTMKVAIQMLEGGDNLTMPPNPFASTSPESINAGMPTMHLNQVLEVISKSE